MEVLGIDYGKRKIGLAIGNSETGLVEPIKTVIDNQLLTIIELIEKNNIGLIVVGLPTGVISRTVRKFGKILRENTNLPVKFSDETLTTLDARRRLGKIGRNRFYQKRMEDATAAAVMLESYLERKAR